jgi:hypothetical protein
VSLILCDGGARAMERSTKISISCLIEYKAKEERGGEKREVLAKMTETLA